jgi:hypothetical protein
MDIIKNIDFKKILNIAYIFDKTPPPDSNYLYLGILFGLMIVLSFGAWLGYGRLKKHIPLWQEMQTRIFNLFFYLGITGLMLIFFRWQGVAYLGSRFFLLLLLIVFIIWGIFIINFRLRIFPKELIKYFAKQKFEKYLPLKDKK